ncbi:helix-turn-helix transcriptional regulator [Actinocorallia sp. A-T 12471]|uniref:helix-turn-helix domain-containing protein n=1 Tax=Actinocorallia sp. A-T 12471 TaxID=3089813 RepID=UPI0029CE8378|nr:helix-turn-helix transcriptional regulator [Actinocorallia sp. A-T 12471]MDX6744637.1 helix-turn-helix transcriptional regulator [Actinocorallia sp. A-T 12471]
MRDGTTDVGDRLRALRRRRGLSQERLAEAAGLSLGVVKKIERGGSARMETYHALARALGVETVWFVSPASPRPVEGVHDEAILADMRAAIIPPVALSGRPLYGTADDDSPDLARLRLTIASVATAYHADRYDDLAELIPSLVRSAHHHVDVYDDPGHEREQALRLRADITQLAGRYLIQVRCHDLALMALHQSLRDALAVGDMPLAAAAVSSQAWAMMRQGRFGEVERLCADTSDEIEPRLSRATARDLFGWGKLLTRAAAAAARNNRFTEARDYQRMATAAGNALGRQHKDMPGHQAFGPVNVAMMGTEVELLGGQPDRALAIAASIARSADDVNNTTLNRHRLDLASAHLRTGNSDEATEILTGLRRDHGEWLQYQQYGRDVTRALLATRARTLTTELRDLAEFMNVED